MSIITISTYKKSIPIYINIVNICFKVDTSVTYSRNITSIFTINL
nr:MAG TPA: hypothetical protein [Caudoviricetes sp.]